MDKAYIELDSKPGKEDYKLENYIEKKRRRELKHSILVRIVLTVVLVISITIAWISLMCPLIVGYLRQHPTANISRPFLGILNQTKNVTNCNMHYNATNTTIFCPDNFVYNYNSCVPICGKWHPFGDSYFIAYRVCITVVGILSLIFSVLGLIALIPVKNSFHFPKLFYFIMFATLIALNCVLIIAAVAGPHTLFCGGRDEGHEVVAKDPPIVVTLLGIISHYSFMSFQICFCVAVLNIFIVIYFPAFMLSVKRKKILKFTDLIVCLALPALFPIINIAVYRQYSFIRLPVLPFPLADRSICTSIRSSFISDRSNIYSDSPIYIPRTGTGTEVHDL